MAAQRDLLLADFPFSDARGRKLRPVLVLARLPGRFPDLLVMFISTQVQFAEPGIDFVLDRSNPGFRQTGLKQASVFRTLKLGTLSETRFAGKIGTLSPALYAEIIRPLVDAIGGMSRA